MYINITASDDESTVTNVWLQWLNETTWNNWTYAFTNTVDDRWEINTSGIIQTHEGYNYSFNIVANSSGGTKTHVWRKPTPGSAYLRRYVQLNCTRVNVTYFPLYLVDNTPQTTEYGAVDVNKADRLHHDQGADTTITDTGYLNSTIPDDIVRDRYCSSFTGNYFEDSVATSLSLNNIYYHTWVSQGEELGSNISFEFWESRDYLKLYFDCTAPARRNWDTTNYTFNRSEIYYDNDLPAEYSDTYYLLTGTINTTNTSIKFNDNNIYELVFVVISRTYNDPTPDNHYPAVMSNRSFTSFVLLNVPSNETLNASHPDTDSDTLSDWQELYQTYTNPFLSDTDNDGINDYWENQAGSDPNNYTETFNVSEAWQNITSISGVFQNTTAHNNITSEYSQTLHLGIIYLASAVSLPIHPIGKTSHQSVVYSKTLQLLHSKT